MSGLRQWAKDALPPFALDFTRSLRRTLGARVPRPVVAIDAHRRTHGASPRLIAPRTFNEKLLHRKLFDRRPLLATLADKFAVRSYVEARLGPGVLPQLIACVADPAALPFDRLPSEFVVKPSHGSGWVRIVRDPSTLDRTEFIDLCRRWLATNYYDRTGDRIYRNIPPRILVEELIDDGSGSCPTDYKLFTFDGHVRVIQVDTNRFTAHHRDLYTPDWQRLDVVYGYPNSAGGVPRPPHLAQMLAAAETLGRDLDFIRADFYDTGRRIVFGELTVTPGNGLDWFRPREFDAQLGAFWTLPKLHWMPQW